MKKLYSLLFLLLLSVGFLAACGQDEKPTEDNKAADENEQTEQSAFPITIKDASDQEVVIEEEPQKIVSLIPSNTEIAFALGLGEKVVGVSDYDNYPEEVMDIDKIGGMDMNIEKILSLNPDLVLAHASSAHNSSEGLQQLKDAGITVIVINDATSFDQVYTSIEMIGKATGKQPEAEQVVEDIKGKIEDIKAKVADVPEPKTVVVEVDGITDIIAAGKNTFIDEMLSVINAKNGVGDLDGWPMVDPERLVEINPDVIVTTYATFYPDQDIIENVKTRAGWQDVTAVKNNQVYDVHNDLVTRSGPRFAEGVEELAKAVYPEIFNQ